MPGLASGILFAIPFWTISRAARPAIVSNYLLIAAIGIILLQFCTLAGLIWAPYPPFGLYSVSTTGLASLFILVGIYSSAISTAEDATIRKRIRNDIIREAKMLGSIGSAEMEQALSGKVMEIAKNNADSLYEETGVQPSLTDEEMNNYLVVVMDEIKKSGFHQAVSRKGPVEATNDSVKKYDSEVE
jgi:hypothetical protein